jgi:hypothetical protein
MTTRPCIVTDHRHHDTRAPSLVDDILEVVWVRKLLPTAATAVFVVGLVEDNRSAIRYLVFCNKAGNVRDIAGSRVLVRDDSEKRE